MKKSYFTVGIYDRLVSAISYLTAGWGGFIILILMHMRRKTPSRFLTYNVFQAIFVSLLYYGLSLGFGFIFKFLSYIPILNYSAAQISFAFNRPIFFNYSFIQLFMIGLILYMAIVSLFGRCPRVYWVSDIIDNNT